MSNFKRLSPADKTTRAMMLRTESVQGEFGSKKTFITHSIEWGKFRQHSGGLINIASQEVTAERTTFYCDYRADLADIECIQVHNETYRVKHVNNIEQRNLTLAFELELNQ